MEFSAKIVDIKPEATLKIIECKFNSKDDSDNFYTLAKTQIIHKAVLRNGAFVSNDENVVSIGYEPEDKEFVMNFVNKYLV